MPSPGCRSGKSSLLSSEQAMNKQDSNNPGKRGNLYFFMMDLIKKSRPFGRRTAFRVFKICILIILLFRCCLRSSDMPFVRLFLVLFLGLHHCRGIRFTIQDNKFCSPPVGSGGFGMYAYTELSVLANAGETNEPSASVGMVNKSCSANWSFQPS